MTTTPNTLAGRPINGDIQHYGSSPTEQKPIEEFLAALDAVFAFPEVQSIKWQQYTPYFNDGDACEFSIYEPRVQVEGVAEDDGDYEDGYITAWDIKWGNVIGPGEHNKEVRYPQVSAELGAAMQAFSDAAEGGAHEADLRKAFGDPAEVTATREGFDVEYYEHD